VKGRRKARRLVLLTSWVLVAAVAPLPCVPASASGQVAPQPEAADGPGIPPPLPISPGGAFWRALLVPGWGHAAIGAHGRGAFYAGAQASTVYALLRTRIRLVEARKSLQFREKQLRAAAVAGGTLRPDDIQAVLDEDDVRTELQALIDGRESQQEDLLAFSIFLVLLSSADAYVSAHLARFPEPLALETRPSPGGGMDVGLRIPLGN
jgi:hypothetical protein